ncbi:MAG: ABC transporter permease [Nitrospinota bacterium]|nr:MAG: ABC transporter permease [Nitrospinota bacterium]
MLATKQRTLHYAVRKEEVLRSVYRLKKSLLSLIGLAICLGMVGMAIFAPSLAPYPRDAGKVVHFDRAFTPPNGEHPFGTDQIGRDILSRTIYGARVSLSLGFIVITLAILIGVPLGLIAGYFGGIVDTLIMRTTDVFLALPSLVLALAVSAALEPSYWHTVVAISFGWWTWYTRLVRGEVLSLKEEQFVEAARSIGAGKFYLAFREILPNTLSVIIVKATLDIGYAILVGASLGFLGLGVQPPTPEWGTMVADGRQYLPERWWVTTFPGLAVFITVIGFNLLGDGLRDIFDVEL